MSRLAPLALGLSIGMSALVALSLPALARGGGPGGGGGGHGGGGRGGGMSMMGGGGGGFGVGRFGGGGGRFAGGFVGGPRVGLAAMGMRPGFAGRPVFAGARFSPRPGFIGRPGYWGRPINRVRWGNRGWWRPGLGVGLGVGLASAPYWGWDDYYASPLINVGFEGGYAGFGGIGGFCATPVRTCQLIDVAPIGTGCSCQVSGGRARGVVSP